jgi:hypothetical protein
VIVFESGMVGAIGLEPTTPTMSSRCLTARNVLIRKAKRSKYPPLKTPKILISVIEKSMTY